MLAASIPTATRPGHGAIVARLLPPLKLTLPTLAYAYPLKLVSSSIPSSKCLTIFLLSYGGGLVSNDKITLTVEVESGVKLCLLTQGSTKIFCRNEPSHLSSQTMTTTLHPSSSLLLLPDPLQPFTDSAYTQAQIFHLPHDDSASLIVLDWVTEGRSALSEHWSFHSFASRNSFYIPRSDTANSQRLLLRDALILENHDGTLQSRMDGLTVFGTLMIRGPMWMGLTEYVLRRFREEPRIGGRNWDGEVVEKRRWAGVSWTAASVRGFVVVKVAGRSLEDVRGFLKEMMEEEGSVVKEFGEGALLCLK